MPTRSIPSATSGTDKRASLWDPGHGTGGSATLPRVPRLTAYPGGRPNGRPPFAGTAVSRPRCAAHPPAKTVPPREHSQYGTGGSPAKTVPPPGALPGRFRWLSGKGRASPGSTPETVPEALRQRHCARGAAAGGMLSACPLIRETGAADFGRRPTGGGAGSQGIWPQAILIENPARRAGSAKRTQAGAAGRSARERPSRVARSGRSPGRPPKPLAPFFGSFLGQARKELAVGRLPTNSTAR